MEDIVAVELTTADGHVCYFITWGRIQSRVEPEPIEQLILSVADHFAVRGTPEKARLCWSLQDAREAPRGPGKVGSRPGASGGPPRRSGSPSA